MSNLIPFDFNGNSLSVVLIKNEPWFIAIDICNALGLSDTNKALLGLDEDEKRKHEQYSGTGRKPFLVNESGLYSLILRSRRPEAKVFKKWVTGEVLPSIRKTGSYTAKQENSGLVQFRQARALKMATESAKDICLMFPSLSEKSKQVIYAGLVNPIAGAEIIPLPKLEQELYRAGDVGKRLGVSSNKVGKIANSLGLKTSEYGMYVLDKSKYSSKQVQNFMYNDKGLEAIRLALAEAS